MKSIKFFFIFFSSLILGSENIATGQNINRPYKFKLNNGDVVTSLILNAGNCYYLESKDILYTNSAKLSKPENLSYEQDIESINIENKEMFLQFERFVSEDNIKDEINIDFDSFYEVSNYLQLKGIALANFAKNMARIGLIDSYIAEIVKDLPYIFFGIQNNITWAIFLEFMEKIGCKVEYDKGCGVATIKATNEKNLYSIDDYELDGKMHKLSIESLNLNYIISYFNLNSSDNIKLSSEKLNDILEILCLFIFRFQFKTLEVGNISVMPEFTNAFVNSFSKFESADQTTEDYHLKSIDISANRIHFDALVPILDTLSNIKSLTALYINALYIPSNCIELFTNLEVFHLEGFTADDLFFEQLLENNPKLKDLKISSKQLTSNLAIKFKDLERLTIDGSRQSPEFFRTLIQNISNIKSLSLEVDDLDTNAATNHIKGKEFKYLNNEISWRY